MEGLRKEKSSAGAKRKAALRLAACLAITCTSGLFVARIDHRAYWLSTIFRVQTVDFNILSHSLAHKLSSLVRDGNMSEVQRTIDSNYGLFYIVVTDKAGEQVLAVNRRLRRDGKWESRKVDSTRLINEVYDKLLDPPPVKPQGFYPHSRSIVREKSTDLPKGEVIGRVYYLRGSMPSFAKSLGDALRFSGSSQDAPLQAIAIASLSLGTAGWLGIESLLYRRRRDRVEAHARERALQQENEALLGDLRERIAINERLELADRSRLQELQQAERNIQEQLELIQKEQSISIDSSEPAGRLITYLLGELSRTRSEKSVMEEMVGIKSEENSLLREEMGRHDLNALEKKIKNQLLRDHPDVEVLIQYDASRGSRSGKSKNSKITDFTLVLDRCVIVLEAKGYKGRLSSSGDSRNTSWICTKGRSRQKINCCWGVNPYLQVKTYCNAIRQRLDDDPAPKLGNRTTVYGAVVFSSGTEISSDFDRDFGDYVSVITLDGLKAYIDNVRNMVNFASPDPRTATLKSKLLGEDPSMHLASSDA
jgi:hypothetical protein